MEVVDIAESDVDFEAVLLDAVLRREHVRLVGLRGGLVARNLDQSGDLYQHGELSVGRSCKKPKLQKSTSKRLLTEEGLLDEVLEEVLGHGGRRLVDQLDDD